MENHDLKEKIRALEAQLERQSSNGFTSADVTEPIHSGARTDFSEDTQDTGSQLTLLTNANTIPEVRECTFMEFKNRFSNQKDGHYAVEVLVSGRLLNQEILEEKRFRERRSASRKTTSREVKKEVALLKAENKQNVHAFRSAQSDETWICSIRLQSPVLLKILSNIQGEPWSTRPRTYERPFTSLIYFHSQMKQALADLEERWADALDGGNLTFPTDTRTRDLMNDGDEDVDNCPAALAVMRAYVTYVDEKVFPAYTQFVNADFSTDTQVRFSDLWYLFRTGELIYRPTVGNATTQRDFRAGKRFWKTYCVQPCSVQYRHTTEDGGEYDKEDEENAAFAVRAYYLEFTGEEFCVATKTFRIPPYDDVVPVSSLPVFPARFVSNWQALLDDATDAANQVLHYIETKHAAYNGWSVIRTPAGNPMLDASGRPLSHAEYINGDVMVDFVEAFQACPAWKPARVVLRPQKAFPRIVSDDFPIVWWSDESRSRSLGEVTEIIPLITGVHVWEQNAFLSQDPLLSKLIANDNCDTPTTIASLLVEDRCLLTGRVFGYVFQERKFVALEVQRLWQSTGTQDALDALRIADKTKYLIQSAVRGHLLQKTAERQEGQPQSLDVINGKGGGLFILLYGMPGVGKTATAEAIAQANGKPLFKITCGDLGLTPDKVESSLKEIFRLAGVWDCILLLDEVDTFFSARSKGDSAMHKNALVSVFLSVMDYYTGILFLTTNLVGALDEAFKSRIHCKINYPALSRQQTREIWQNNLKRLHEIDKEQSEAEGRPPLVIPVDEILQFADDQFTELNQRRKVDSAPSNGWNGRQIRNACQIVRSLALADAVEKVERLRSHSVTERSVPVPTPRLEVRHFHMVREISDSFDKYMVEVRAGMTDSQVAQENEVRADHFVDPWTATPAVENEDYEGQKSYGRGRSQTIPFQNISNIRSRDTTSGRNLNFFSPNRQPQNLSIPSNGPSITVRGASPSSDRGEYADRQPSPINATPRFTTDIFSSRGRDPSVHRRETYEQEPEYRDNRNLYGKRARRNDDIGSME